jgi:hypothetical protein
MEYPILMGRTLGTKECCGGLSEIAKNKGCRLSGGVQNPLCWLTRAQ